MVCCRNEIPVPNCVDGSHRAAPTAVSYASPVNPISRAVNRAQSPLLLCEQRYDHGVI